MHISVLKVVSSATKNVRMLLVSIDVNRTSKLTDYSNKTNIWNISTSPLYISKPYISFLVDIICLNLALDTYSDGYYIVKFMMTSWYRHTLRISGSLCEEALVDFPEKVTVMQRFDRFFSTWSGFWINSPLVGKMGQFNIHLTPRLYDTCYIYVIYQTQPSFLTQSCQVDVRLSAYIVTDV